KPRRACPPGPAPRPGAPCAKSATAPPDIRATTPAATTKLRTRFIGPLRRVRLRADHRFSNQTWHVNSKLSRSDDKTTSFVAQRVDGIQPRGLARRIEPEEDAN